MFMLILTINILYINLYNKVRCQYSLFLSISFQSIYRIKRVSKKDTEPHQLSVDEVCERIFKVIDVDGDGKCVILKGYP